MNNIIINEATQIPHSLTQSGVQGSSTDASASSRSEPFTLNKTESAAPVYIMVVKTSCHITQCIKRKEKFYHHINPDHLRASVLKE